MITIAQVPCLEDNYAWLVVHDDVAFVVDPSECAPVLATLARFAGARLVAVLCTHHHHDHIGGAADLRAATGCAVIGNADEPRIPGVTRPVRVGEPVDVAGLSVRVLDVRAHTDHHVAFALDQTVQRVVRHGHAGVVEDKADLAGRPALFVGDALFAAGCGRLFEGTAADLERALRTLSACDPRALVCCGHEYTAGNLRFARHAFPGHAGIAARLSALPDDKGASLSSVPSTLADELVTNPFLLALSDADPVAAVAAMRRAKDAFV